MAGNYNSGRRPRPPADIKLVRGQKDKRWSKKPDPLSDDAPAAIQDDPEALKEWNRVLPLVKADGYVGTPDMNAVIALCQQWSRYIQAQKGVETEGLVVLRPSGVEAPNPHIRIADTALNQCRQLWTELGLTPCSRGRLAAAAPATQQKSDSKWAGLLT